MDLRNNNGKLKMIIASEIVANNNFRTTIEHIESIRADIAILSRTDNELFNVIFIKDSLMLNGIKAIGYCQNNDMIFVFNEDMRVIVTKEIKDLESYMMTLTTNGVVALFVNETPKFTLVKDLINEYPKLDIHISDCLFDVKIYVSENQYISIPNIQTSLNVNDTLKNISEVAEFLTITNPEFIMELCKNNIMAITINNSPNDESGDITVETVVASYQLIENGVYLVIDDQSSVVDYWTFFGLIIDGQWKVKLSIAEQVEPEQLADMSADYEGDIETDNADEDKQVDIKDIPNFEGSFTPISMDEYNETVDDEIETEDGR